MHYHSRVSCNVETLDGVPLPFPFSPNSSQYAMSDVFTISQILGEKGEDEDF